VSALIAPGGRIKPARPSNRGSRQKRAFAVVDHVWVYHPPRGQHTTKFGHRWMGPMRVVEDAGYENYLLEREDKQGARETVIAHASFLAYYHYPVPLLARAAADIDDELSYEGDDEVPVHDQAHTAPVRAATAGDSRRAATGATGRRRTSPHVSAQSHQDRRREWQLGGGATKAAPKPRWAVRARIRAG